MGSGGSAGRLRGELTEFAGRRSESALVRQARRVAQVARRVNDIAQFPLARVVAVLGSAPAAAPRLIPWTTGSDARPGSPDRPEGDR
jgi:hypothetical protein